VSTKRLVRGSRERDAKSHMDIESATIGGLVAGPEAVEGIEAFLAKRLSVFR